MSELTNFRGAAAQAGSCSMHLPVQSCCGGLQPELPRAGHQALCGAESTQLEEDLAAEGERAGAESGRAGEEEEEEEETEDHLTVKPDDLRGISQL